jgi:excisionase family DNA binding protein
MTVEELSDYLRVQPSTGNRQLKRGSLPAFKMGSDWPVNIESIGRWSLEKRLSTLKNPRQAAVARGASVTW